MSSSKTNQILRLTIGVLLLALIYVSAGVMEQRIVVVGDTAPDFRIVADNGQTITRSEFGGGKLLVLNFWATWCLPCVQELPSLMEFQERMRAKGVVVVGISVDKNEQTYKQFLQRAGVGFATARDPEANISASYGTFKYPETYVINTGGKVVAKFIGPETWTDPKVMQQIESLL
ncbi:MAG TPA: TlpA disulfide reductase family protein [Bryobacteraceae bacterium]|nr:TlpA disulfide reductase family protein [Bryobacteraceae bacterium]